MIAPEILRQDGIYGEYTDVYSLGILLLIGVSWEIINQKFQFKNITEIIENVDIPEKVKLIIFSCLS